MFTRNRQSVLLILLMLALAVMAVACAPGTVAQGNLTTERGGITVVGQGEAFGQPDQARIQLGVETFAETVSEATTQNEETMSNIMAALREEGIAETDIQTSNYNLWADQRYDEQGPGRIIGYRVSNQVSVIIRDINEIGSVMAAVTEAGANAIHGVFFTVADPAALEAEAREKAIANALERAQSLASLSGVAVGDVLAISEVIGQPPPMLRGANGFGAEAAMAPSVSPGQLSYQVQVQVTFAIR